jgi:predicted ATP-dependent protease
MDQIITQNAARDQRALVRALTRPQIMMFMKAMRRWKQQRKERERRVTFANTDQVKTYKVKACKATDPDAISRIEAVKAEAREAIASRAEACVRRA